MSSMMPMVQGMLGQMGAPPGIDNVSADGQAHGARQSTAPAPSVVRDAPHAGGTLGSVAPWHAALTEGEVREWEATIASDMAAIELLEQCDSTQGALSDAYLAGARDARDPATSP
jgi:hypothetical protein